ncbi:hypothetical protein [Streptomyces sp. rh34]|uniref:hypothetical protein n=1 Tax=Streptomyces sp. rh34 TaxID=2034272 RepID=UPI000BF1AF0B|nr:hypothetical protein [Streptomyces sp. rh34]
MSFADEQERLLRAPRRDLDRARRHPDTWSDLAFTAEHTAEGRGIDRGKAARRSVLWALQYDRRPQDLGLLRFLLRQEITFYRELVPWGLASDLTLAGFLVAEHRRAEDIWLHWSAKNISFDTALGYHLYHLLTGGVAAAVEAVRASTHPDRGRVLGDITSDRHTDAAVEQWLDEQRARFPSDPAEESLGSWAHHAAGLGEREASRLFMTAWAASGPRTEDTLNTLRFHLAELGFLTEAVAVQQEVIAVSDAPREAMAFNLLTLGRLQRQAGDASDAWRTLEETRNLMPADKRGVRAGLWRHFVKECFLVVAHTPDDAATRRRFAVSDEHLRGIPKLWMDKVLDAALAAAEHLGDPRALDRYRTLRQDAAREREQGIA